MRYLIFVLLFSSPVFATEPPSTPELMRQKCGKCHEENGDRTHVGAYYGAPENIFTEVDGLPIEDIVEIIKKGKGEMPGFEGELTEEQISNIANRIDYTNISRRIKEKYDKIDRELNSIKKEYKNLPPCEERYFF